MKSKDKQNIQIVKAAGILQELRPNVTASDKQAAMKELNVGAFTVSEYLRGKGNNLDTATDLLRFFRKRVSQREKAIA